LTGALSSAQVHNDAHHYVKKHCGIMKAMRLKTTVDYAFTLKQAGTFSTHHDTVKLAQRCKNTGCAIGLCSNWNKELFDNLKRVHNGVLGFFDENYISGYCGMIAAVPAFYDAVINKYGAENIVLVDRYPENIRAAKSRGIKTISYTSAAAAERELKKMGFLS